MEEAKQEVTSNVRTLNRASNKAGAELAAAELDKRRQDIFVDRLTQRVEHLQGGFLKFVIFCGGQSSFLVEKGRLK